MSRSYFTEDAKMVRLTSPKWTLSECETIREILTNKGYDMNCVTRIGCDGKPHDAFQIERKDAPRLVEQLFRQRLVAEFQAEGNGKSSIIFSHDYSAETIIYKVKRFLKNRGDD